MDINAFAKSHVRVITQAADRRINGAKGSTHALCFGVVTVHDVSYRDAKKMSQREREMWVSCPDCRSLLTGGTK
jgi:hypothetical protein